MVAMRFEEQHLRRILDALPHIAWAVSGESHELVYVNQRWLSYSGETELDLARMMDHIHPEDRGRVRAEIDSREDGRSHPYELRLRSAKGDYEWFRVEPCPVLDDDGRTLYWIGTTTNIQHEVLARQAAQEASAEYERLLKAVRSQAELLELAHDAIFVQKFDGTLTYWNRSAERKYGWPREEALGKNVHDLLHTRGEHTIPEILDELQKAGVWFGDLIHRRRDGRELIVSSKWALRPHTDGEPAEVLEIVRDVTEERRAQALLEASEKALQEANEALEHRVAERTADLRSANERLESFTYHVSHDLRSPLRAIISTSKMLELDFGPLLPNEALPLLERQALAAHKLSNLIDDLLKLSRLAREEIQRSQVDLTALAKVCAAEAAAQFPSSKVQFEAEEGLVACADSRLIYLAIENLIDNAYKYSPRGGTVRFGRKPGVGFFVSDEGIGMEPQYLQKIFQPFQRLHRDDEFPGNGIGLANVRQVIERHGGAVWVESELGKGSTFWFTLGGA